MLCFALPCFGSLEEGLAERDERAERKALEEKVSEDFAEERKTNPQPHRKSSRKGEGGMTALTRRRQGKDWQGNGKFEKSVEVGKERPP